ncbi:MAG: T9SS type A sorting domain-containing protein [Paludibacteraceae bacterium]
MKKIVVIIVCLLTTVCLSAEPVTNDKLPYFCGFENAAEMDAWVLNPGSTTVNVWVADKAEAYVGKQALYVSNDAGNTMACTNTPNIVLAYCEFTITEAGAYDIAFDWKGGGSSKAYMRVLWTTRDASYLEGQVNASEPTWWPANTLTFDDDATLYGRLDDWQHEQVQVKVAQKDVNKTFRLVFAWLNTDAKADSVSVAIDNVQLARATDCGLPHDLLLSSNGSTASFMWSGGSSSYELKYRLLDTDDWHIYTAITDSVYTIKNVAVGVYDIWIRGVCETDTTRWVQFPKKYIYETQCFDFLNITDEQCSSGTWSVKSGAIVLVEDADHRYIDYGCESADSRQTTHYRQDEYDVRTNGKLKTVPEGAVASVRLGNWKTNSQWEKLSYTYTVDAQTASILLLQYAIVLENPDHEGINQPRFLLEIFDKEGKLINPTCGKADFHAPAKDDSAEMREGWETAVYTEGSTTKTVNWKDWTTVGLDLSQYDGQMLTIELTTYDCSQGGHFGYAYFTLNCTSGKIGGMNCGDTPTTEFIAPYGFLYAWTCEDDPTTVLSTDRVFPVDQNDPRTYYCRVTYPTEAACYFTLEASAIPRYPIAQIGWEWIPNNCSNGIMLKNTSYIRTVNQQTGAVTNTDKPCETAYWTLPDGTHSGTYSNLYIPCSNDGDTLLVSLVSGINNGDCSDSTSLVIYVPAIGPRATELYDAICGTESYTFADRVLTESGIYVDSLKAFTGCDSIVTLHLTVFPTYDLTVYDTIPHGGNYEFGAYTLTESGVTTDIFATVNGCDSIVTLHLTVLDAMHVYLESVDDICADDSEFAIHLGADAGDPATYQVKFADQAQVQHFMDFAGSFADGELNITVAIPAEVAPDKYMATVLVRDACFDSVAVAVEFDVKYKSSILTQRWNDVIGIYNKDNNGGYELLSYQWYKNGQMLQGETKPYLYESDGLDTTAVYAVELGRIGSDAKVLSCAMTPAYFPETIDVVPTVVASGDNVEVSLDKAATVTVYSTMGIALRQSRLPMGVTSVPMTFSPGVYMLVVRVDDYTKTFRVEVK